MSYAPIENYAIIGDIHTAALIGLDGSPDWAQRLEQYEERIPMHKIAEQIYETCGEMRVLPGWYFPLRTVVVQLPSDELWVHSPGPLTDEVARAVDELGPVRFLILPSNLHHLFAGEWKQRWPKAEIWAARGLIKKRPDLAIDRTLDEDSLSFPGIEHQFVAGVPAASETVFFHTASQTLICTDLIFNLNKQNTRGWLTPIIIGGIANAYGRPAQSRIIRWATKDRKRAGDSIERILQWPFERVAPSHGDLIEKNAPQTLREACRWMLEAKRED